MKLCPLSLALSLVLWLIIVRRQNLQFNDQTRIFEAAVDPFSLQLSELLFLAVSYICDLSSISQHWQTNKLNPKF